MPPGANTLHCCNSATSGCRFVANVCSLRLNKGHRANELSIDSCILRSIELSDPSIPAGHIASFCAPATTPSLAASGKNRDQQ